MAVAKRKQRKPSPEKPAEPKPEVIGDAKRAFEERPKQRATRSPYDQAGASHCRNTSRPRSTCVVPLAMGTAEAPRSTPPTRSPTRSCTSSRSISAVASFVAR